MFEEGMLCHVTDRLLPREDVLSLFSQSEKTKNPSAQYSLTGLHQPVKQQLGRFVQRGNRTELCHGVSVCLIGLDRAMVLTTQVCFQQHLTSSVVFTLAF